MKINKKVLFILVLLTLIVLAGVAIWQLRKDSSPSSITTSDGQNIQLKPATEEERDQAEQKKNEIVKKDEQPNTAPPSATMVISSIDANQLRAYISGIFEEGGTCSATAKKDSRTSSGSSVGFQNVSYTQCAPINWGSPLTAGRWTIDVNYQSVKTKASAQKVVDIQ